MYCYNCPESAEESTKTISTTNASDIYIYGYAKKGNGAVRISKVNTITEVKYNSNYDISMVPVRDGYKFKEWNIKQDGTGKTINSSSNLDILENHTLYAIWERYSILTIDLNGGIDNKDYDYYYKSGSTILLEDPIREGYTFTGFVIESGVGSISGNKLTIGNDDIVVKATWSANTYYVTLDANSGIFSSVEYVDSGEKSYNIPYTGKYILEVWGAQGGYGAYGSTPNKFGGYGGYSVGEILLEVNNKLYINVGEQGGQYAGGYNGGGSGVYSRFDEYSGGGGGATHIATQSGELLELSNFAGNNSSAILIVAGGGGGGSTCSSTDTNEIIGGGSGGGKVGGSNYRNNANGASQVGSGSILAGFGNVGIFGKGGNGYIEGNSCESSGGGGGGYYGGVSNNYGGTGGSGYIANSLLSNKAMYCYNCSESAEESTKTISTANVSDVPISKYVKKNNGAARISQITLEQDGKFNAKYNFYKTPVREGYVFKEWNTKKDGTGVRIKSYSVMNIPENHTLYAIWE